MLTGLVLAGGRSSRMGRDKAALRLPDGRTLLERQVDILRAAGATAVLASVRPGEGLVLPNVINVLDEVADAGPLAGIAAGLRAAPPGRLLVLAVDMPFVQGAHLRQLVALADPGCGVVPMLGEQCEPLVAVYPTTLASSAGAALADGRGSVQAWARAEAKLGRLRLWESPAEWAEVFRSMNTPADVQPGYF